jgi:hypothetical protein
MVSWRAAFSALFSFGQVAMGQFGGQEGRSVNLNEGVPENLFYAKDRHPVPWEVSFPEVCTFGATSQRSAHTDDEQYVPGLGSKRIAFVLRGDSFRGLSWSFKPYFTPSGGVERRGKDPFTCTENAVQIQKVTVAAMVEMMIEPMEKQGFEVDVYLSGYGCTGLYHLKDAARIQNIHEQLISWFNIGKKRVKAYKFIDRQEACKGVIPTKLQDVGTAAAVQLLLDNAPLDYHSVIMWRYDMIPLSPIHPSNKLASPHWANLAERSAAGLFFFNDDWGYTVPGWYAPCFIGVFLHNCMDNALHCKDGLRANFPGTLQQQTLLPLGNYDLYRSDFDQWGENTDSKLCRFLEERGGPSCHATPLDALKAACKMVSTVPGWRADHPMSMRPPIHTPDGFVCYPGWK